MAATFGLVGFYWRKLPERVHHALVPIGLAMSALAYLGISVTMHGGTQGSPLMWGALVMAGAGVGLSASPLLTQSLVHVPLSNAADASGLLTTTMQLGQVVGVAAFGTLFLSLEPRSAEHFSVQASAAALSATGYWLALLSVIGVVAGITLSRTVLRAKRFAVQVGR